MLYRNPAGNAIKIEKGGGGLRSEKSDMIEMGVG